MARTPLPPLAVVVSFVDCINRGDLAGLGALMSDDHHLVVLDDAPLVGRDANVEAWRGYFSAFPEYVVYPRHVTVDGDRVAVLGTTTGSHLGLPDEEEMRLDVIWLAEVTADGTVSWWQVAEDNPAARRLRHPAHRLIHSAVSRAPVSGLGERDDQGHDLAEGERERQGV